MRYLSMLMLGLLGGASVLSAHAAVTVVSPSSGQTFQSGQTIIFKVNVSEVFKKGAGVQCCDVQTIAYEGGTWVEKPVGRWTDVASPSGHAKAVDSFPTLGKKKFRARLFTASGPYGEWSPAVEYMLTIPRPQLNVPIRDLNLKIKPGPGPGPDPGPLKVNPEGLKGQVDLTGQPTPNAMPKQEY